MTMANQGNTQNTLSYHLSNLNNNNSNNSVVSNQEADLTSFFQQYLNSQRNQGAPSTLYYQQQRQSLADYQEQQQQQQQQQQQTESNFLAQISAAQQQQQQQQGADSTGLAGLFSSSPQSQQQRQQLLQQQQQRQQQQANSNNNNMQFQVANPYFLAGAAGLPQVTQYRPQARQRPFGGRANLNDRECFFIFVKILMKLTANNPLTKNRAKQIISECTRRNRMGEPEFTPLQDAIEHRLRGVIGELNWTRARLYFDAYCERNGIRNNIEGGRHSSLPPVAPV